MRIDAIVVFIGCYIIVAYYVMGLKKRPPETGCKHHVTSDWRWSQDGWVKVCLVCREWIYGGEDYEDMP